MFDVALRRLVDPALIRMAGWITHTPLSANMVTISGAGLALGAAFSVTQSNFTAALVFILLNRIVDGLDGAVARINGPTAFGGYLDTICDYIFYLSVPIAFGLTSAINQIPALLLVASFTLTAVSFLAFAALAEKRGFADTALPGKSFYFLGGLTEATETIAVFASMCMWPMHFAVLAYSFATLCSITTVMRVVWGYQRLR